MIIEKLVECLINELPAIIQLIFKILCSNSVSTNILNSLNISKQSLLDFNTYNHPFHEKSSTKVKKYLAPLMDIILKGPQTSECTISKRLVARLLPHSKRQPYVVCLQYMLHKTTRMVGKKIFQGLYCLPYFEGYKHSSLLNGQGGGAKARERHLPLEIGQSSPLPLYAPLQN